MTTLRRLPLAILVGVSGSLLGAVWAGPEFVKIPAGTYRPPYNLAPNTGKAGQKPPPTSVAAFTLARYPVTNQEYLEFVKKNPQWRRSRTRRIFAEKGYLSHWKGDLQFDPALARSPVVNISWFAARAYCRAGGYRLPTQQEWEFVAQASWDKPNGLQDQAFRQQILNWYGRPTPKTLPSVGKGFRNYYGVDDMHGLVWEWVEDFNTILVTGESRGDSSLERDLYCAGGSVGSVDPSDYASSMRYAFRASLQARYTVNNLGFRCAAKEK